MTATVECPTCGQRVEWSQKSRWRPFCSERCKLIDLGEWADERKRIPGERATPWELDEGEPPRHH